MRTLVWFRSDLRLHDNSALHDASTRGGDGVVGLFVVSPDQWKGHDYAPGRVQLILRSLAELSESLSALNIPLVIETATRAGDVPGLVAKAAGLVTGTAGLVLQAVGFDLCFAAEAVGLLSRAPCIFKRGFDLVVCVSHRGLPVSGAVRRRRRRSGGLPRGHRGCAAGVPRPVGLRRLRSPSPRGRR